MRERQVWTLVEGELIHGEFSNWNLSLSSATSLRLVPLHGREDVYITGDHVFKAFNEYQETGFTTLEENGISIQIAEHSSQLWKTDS